MSESIGQLLTKGVDQLQSACVPDARLSAEYLLAHVTGKSRSDLYVEPAYRLTPSEQDRFSSLIERRAARYPLQYLLGSAPFRNVNLIVGEGCLIPRPETELLVQKAVERIQTRSGTPFVLDIGTGSGNIAVSIAQECPSAVLYATDRSAQAIRFARLNAARNGVSGQIHFLRSDLWPKKAGLTFDVLISNPPYLADKEFEGLQEEVRFEPRNALSGGKDGLDFYRRIVQNANQYLKPQAAVFFEVGYRQADRVADLLAQYCFDKIYVTQDHSGLDRIVSGEFKSNG